MEHLWVPAIITVITRIVQEVLCLQSGVKMYYTKFGKCDWLIYNFFRLGRCICVDCAYIGFRLKMSICNDLCLTLKRAKCS